MMINRSSQVEYSRYMRMIGEQEAPIKTKTFTLYNVDVSLEHLDEDVYRMMQDKVITEMIFEDIISTSLNYLWRMEYINLTTWDINMFECVGSGLYTIGGIAEPTQGIMTESKILLTMLNVDISPRTCVKPKIIRERYEPRVIQIENTEVSLESFSRYFETMNRMEGTK